jgi:hypothetical protein
MTTCGVSADVRILGRWGVRRKVRMVAPRGWERACGGRQVCLEWRLPGCSPGMKVAERTGY